MFRFYGQMKDIFRGAFGAKTKDYSPEAMRDLQFERLQNANLRFDSQTREVLPRILWSYWEGETPEIVHLCVRSWKRNLPDFELRFLNSATLLQYLPNILNPAHIDPANYSDWVRLSLLSTHGGLWIDASVLVRDGEPIRKWFQKVQNKEIFGLTNHVHTSIPQYPVLESWLLIAPRNSLFVAEWLGEFEYALSIGVDRYRRKILNGPIDTQVFPLLSSYHAVYAAHQMVMQRRPFFLEYGCTVDSGPYWAYDLEGTIAGTSILNKQIAKLINKDRIRIMEDALVINQVRSDYQDSDEDD